LIVASAALHNIFRDRNIPLLLEDQLFRDEVVIPYERETRRLQGQIQELADNLGVETRNNLIANYFNNGKKFNLKIQDLK
jgi:hypothetical protein